MAILIDKTTQILVQGITGREGQKTTKEMINYGSKVVAGVTPGKGDSFVEDIPVFNTVSEALENFPKINASLVYVPPSAVKDAVFESIENGIKLINIIAEKVPIHDTAEIYAFAVQRNATVVGPSSVGIISPKKAKIGPIGGSNPNKVFEEGKIGVISKSGGMSSEISWILRQNGFGQSTVVGMGGDIIACSNFTDLMEKFEKDKQTKALVLFGEIGGTYEEQVAEMIKEGFFSKPVAAFISGKFAESIRSDVTLGHAGAIIQGNKGTTEAKRKALESANVRVANIPDELPQLLKEQL